jgi:AcrR family transcriptional regulator
MATVARQNPRPYLAAPRRRDQLLEAAGRLVRRGGWSALSMQGVAAAAGVSRQLVYEHFTTADDLYVATLVQLFERAYARTEAIARAGAGVAATIRASFELFLDLPAEERRALRALAGEAEPARRVMARARERLRSRIAGIWVPFVVAQTGVDEGEGRALAWMLHGAAWALADSVAEGALGRDEALEWFVRTVEGTLATWRRAARDREPRAQRHTARRGGRRR